MDRGEFLQRNREAIKAMKEKHMYQIIGGMVVEVVRRGDKLVPLEEVESIEGGNNEHDRDMAAEV